MRKETVLLSYKEHIVRWLEACIEKVALIPTIRETLQQYLELIKKLTGRALNEEETMEVKKLFLDNKDYMEAFANAQEGFVAAQKELLEKFCKELKERFENEYKNIEEIYGCECVPICEIEGKDTISFFISKYHYTWKKDLCVHDYGFMLYKKDSREPSIETLQETIRKNMKKFLGKSYTSKSDGFNEISPWWKSYSPDLSLTDFTKDEVCDLHFDKKERDKFVDENFQGFKKLIDTLKQSEEFKKYNWLV